MKFSQCLEYWHKAQFVRLGQSMTITMLVLEPKKIYLNLVIEMNELKKFSTVLYHHD
jgi:hypothetical protein